MAAQDTNPHIPKEYLHENVCFKLTDDIPDTELLAVVAALQAYLKDAQLKNDGWNTIRKDIYRVLTIDLYLFCSNVSYRRLLQEVLPVKAFLDKAEDYPPYFSMYREIRRDRALEIAKATGRHAAQCYGILIGSEPSSIPDMTGLSYKAPETTKDLIIVVPDDKSCKVGWQIADLVRDSIPSLLILLRSSLDKLENRGRLAKASIVVGFLGFDTYLASCFGCGVIELYPTTMQEGWLTKWSNQFYRQLRCDNLDNPLDREALKVAVEQTWQKIQSKRSAAEKERERITQTAQEMSTARVAEDTSAQ